MSAVASEVVVHLSDNPEEICVDFGPHLKSGETISSPAIVGYVVNNQIQASAPAGISVGSEAVNTSTFTSPNGETVAANEGITLQVTPSAVGDYYVVVRATSSDSPRVPAITQPIKVKA